MVELRLTDGTLFLEVRGWSRLWTLKHRLQFPFAAIRDIQPAAPVLARKVRKGLRLIGINIPGLITAGVFRHHRRYTFWNVRHPSNAVVIELAGERYARLIVEVPDPENTVREVRDAVRAISWNK